MPALPKIGEPRTPDSERETRQGRAVLKPSVGIVCAYGYLDTVSVLCDLTESLADGGYNVEILTDTWPGFVPPEFSSAHVTVSAIVGRAAAPSRPPSGGRLRDLAKDVARKLHMLDLLRRVTAAGRRVSAAVRRISAAGGRVRWLGRCAARAWRARRSPYACVIGVDPQGLILAADLARLARAPLAYYSLELLLSGELNTAEDRLLKSAERRLSQQASFVVIQDEQRARLLATDNSLSMDRFVLAPNAPRGPARRRTSGWWHERFTLPREARVVLYAGSIGAWTGVDQIVRGAAGLPDPWVLVVHTRYDPTIHTEASGALEQLRSIARPEKTFFSTAPVPRSEYGALVDGADVGVAFYVPSAGSTYTQSNIAVIGLSSGKVADYLRAGLPVIVNAESTLAELSERERFGMQIRHGLELGGAVAHVASDYEGFSLRAREFFDRELDFRRSANQIVERITAGYGSQGSAD